MRRRMSPDQRTSATDRVISIVAFSALMVVPLQAHAQPTTIDDFESVQSELVVACDTGSLPISTGSAIAGPGILGGAREVALELEGCSNDAVDETTAEVAAGFFTLSQDPDVSGNAVITWDGNDGLGAFDPTGLGGVDLVQMFNPANAQFDVSISFADQSGSITIDVYTDAGNASTLQVAFSPQSLQGTTMLPFPFGSFTTSLGGGADFTNVGAVVMTVTGDPALDIRLEFLETTPVELISFGIE